MITVIRQAIPQGLLSIFCEVRMNSSWKGLKALQLLNRQKRPLTEKPKKENLVFIDGIFINDETVFYSVDEKELMIMLTGDEENVPPAYFIVE